MIGVVGVAQDVADDRKHSQELQEMQYVRYSHKAQVEMERNMPSYFAHELRNPLYTIDSALNAIPNNISPQVQSLVHTIQVCKEFISTGMNNLLDVRKMEEGKMMLYLIPISLEEILSSVHKTLSPSVRPGVKFIAKYKTGNNGWVLGDSHGIQQVMINVITNVVKYTMSHSISLVIEW